MTLRMLSLPSTLALALLGSSASAQVLNGSFESNAANSTTITSWSKVGHAYVADTTNYQDPFAGTKQAVMATSLDGTYGEPAGDGTTPAAAETALGLFAGQLTAAAGLSAPANVSAIYQSVTFNAGDKLVFASAILTNQVYNTGDASSRRPEVNQNDFAFLSLSSAAGANVVRLGDMFSGYVDTNPGSPFGFTTKYAYDPNGNDPFLGAATYSVTTITFATGGTYKIGFGVANASVGTANGINTGFLVDDVKLDPVPEPTTLAVFGVGALALVRRRARKG